MHFIGVGTPQKPRSHAADLSYVDMAVQSLLQYLITGDHVVGKSTFPIRTPARLAGVIAASGSDASLAWNPDFLREGFAVKDTISPDRLVYGVPVGGAGVHATALLNEVYASALVADTPLIVTDYATAEPVKVAANAFRGHQDQFHQLHERDRRCLRDQRR